MIKRARLITSVIAPRENMPHKAIFCRVRSCIMQLIMKNGRMNTVKLATSPSNVRFTHTEQICRPIKNPIDYQGGEGVRSRI
jgi:hypothetical protein